MDAPLKKRKGIRQRLANDTVVTPVVLESGLASFLLAEFSWGAMSAQLVQKIALLATKDCQQSINTGGILKDLESLSKLGGSGHHPNNVHRDIMKFSSQSLLPVGLDVQIPFKQGLKLQRILLPHEMFAAIFTHYPEAWCRVINPEASKLVSFWQAQATHPNMEGNPIKSRGDYQTKCIPLGFHGNEVPMTGKGKCWCKSMLTFEWCSLLGVGSTCERMIWVWGTFDKLLVADETTDTLAVFWKVLSWSFFWLQQGVWPKTDWLGNHYPLDSVEGQRAGTFLAGGYYATLWAVMGDLDYLAKTLKLPRSTSSNPCSLCRCTLHGENSWKQNHDTAPWKNTLWKPLEWVAWEGRSKVGLWSIPGVSAVTVALDWMHNKYLGIDQYLYGSILYILCFMILPLSPVANLQTCWNHIKSYYNTHLVKNRFQSITKLSMFIRKTGVIKLRGKAGELRGIGPAIFDLWCTYMNPALQIHSKIKLLLKLNNQVEELLAVHSHSVCLPSQAATKCTKYVFAMIQMQTELETYFSQDADCTQQLFNVTGKYHMILHSAMLSSCIHPWLVWCFMGEDFMRKIQRIGEACVRGLQPTQVSTKMVSHYRLALHLQLKKAS
jgi:hypothetical protein